MSFRNLAVPLTMVMTLSYSTALMAHEDRIFLGYETLEMVMNEFQYFAGEVGYRYSEGRQVRLSIAEVKLTERHLSSSWEAYAVEGENVEGYLRGYELNHDWFFWGGWYVSGSAGYFNDYYSHLETSETLESETFTLGGGLGYFRDDLFGVEGLYLNFANPVRFYFNPIEETSLGDATVREHVIVNNLWLIIGYNFAF